MPTGQNVTRKLRAILSADVKGYSLLMADDEVHTIEILKKYRQIMSSLIDQHSGRVVDNPGDNVLAEFSSAVDAVNCAVQIQNRLKKENAKFVEDRRLQFRLQDEITLNIIKEVGIILVGGKQGIERTANIDDLGLAIQGLK